MAVTREVRCELLRSSFSLHAAAGLRGELAKKLWLPATMDERHATPGGLIEGKATYSNFRQFGVATETVIE